MAKPYAPVNEVQSDIATGNTWTRGTDTSIVLTDGSDFDDGGGYIRIGDQTSFALMEYTGRTSNTLTGLTACTLGVVVSSGDETKEWPAGTEVSVVFAAEKIDDIQGEQADKIDEDGSVPLTGDWDIGDGRYIAGDKIRARDGAGLLLEDDGGNGIAISDGGVITMAKQSACVAYPVAGTSQQLEASYNCKMLCTNESFDIQAELDLTVKTGTASSTSANHLVDATLSPFVAADVGRAVWNTTDDTYAIITVYNSTSDVTLDTDIMASGEGYKVYASRFTTVVAGLYLVTVLAAVTSLAQDKEVLIKIRQNGATVNAAAGYSNVVGGEVYMPALATLYLEVGDYIEAFVQQYDTVVRTLVSDVGNSNLCVTKVA